MAIQSRRGHPRGLGVWLCELEQLRLQVAEAGALGQLVSG